MKNQWWFFTAYFGMFLLSPFLNRLLKTMGPSDALKLLAVCIVILTVIPIVSGGDLFKLSNGYALPWFLMLYLMGGCLRIRSEDKAPHCLANLGLYLVFVLLAWGFILAFKFAGIEQEWFSTRALMMVSYTSPLILGAAIALFRFCLALPLSGGIPSRAISWIAPNVFAVYLISDNLLVRAEMMKGAFAQLAQAPIFEMLGIVAAAAICIFVVCVAIDKVRGLLFKLLRIDAGVAKLGGAIDGKLVPAKQE